MRFQVPQFVDIEDKIIGPFTLKQFLIYLAAVMVLVPIYLVVDLSLFITLAVPVGALAALFAHFRLHGKSLFAVIGNAWKFAARGQLFLWRRTPSLKPLAVRGPEYEAATDLLDTASLSARARSLDTVGSIVDEDIDDEIAAEPSAQ